MRPLTPSSISSLPDSDEEFAEIVHEALAALPPDIAERIDNVAIEIEHEAPGHPNRLGLYRRPIERISAGDPERLRAEIRHVVVHELAHHFGISDERLRELDRY